VLAWRRARACIARVNPSIHARFFSVCFCQHTRVDVDGLTMVVCMECLPADKPWDVVSVTRRIAGVAPRACVRMYARVLVPPNLYIHTYPPFRW